MKMVKSLLLGSAAGLVAVSGAQAADLPVKARAVEYVKVCSVYGAGFYYIPGTDTCVKVGGYVRMDVGINAGGSHSPEFNGAPGANTRFDPDYQTRVRGIVSWDARTSTDWGTLRAYIRAGWELNSGDANYRGICYFDRAFIQFGGLTVGKTQSFYGFYNNALNYSTLFGTGQSDTGVNLIAYTMQFAGGFSATISAEDTQQFRGGIWDAASSGLTNSAFPGGQPPAYGDYRANRYPDIIGNIRVEQPWGAAQLTAALHDTSGAYYGPSAQVPAGIANTNLAGSSGLDDTGYAVQAGIKFNLPWAKGDELWLQAAYAHGATNYLGLNPFVQVGGQIGMFSGSPGVGCTNAAPTNGIGTGACGTATFNYTMDGVFNTAANGGIALVDGYALTAAIQHYWTPNLRTSVFGHYTKLEFDSRATTIYCQGANLAGGGVQFINGTAAANAAGQRCDPDYSITQIGTRTIWSPVANLDIGVEVLYSRVDQNMQGNYNVAAANGRPAGSYAASDQETWSGTVRFQRNFWP